MPHHESRWPPIVTILIVLAMQAALPARLRGFPVGIPMAIVTLVLVPMVTAGLARTPSIWFRIEQIVVFVFATFVEVVTIVMLQHLVRVMLDKSGGTDGLWLLSSSIAVWLSNTIAFSLIYWQLDRGGPAGRAMGTGPKPDWLFAQAGAGDAVDPGWGPVFVDYLFLGFTTATAFSPTDALPLTSRAKLLMMVESSVSLVTILVTVSRAINTLA